MDKPELEEFVQSFTPVVRELTQKTRALILESIPNALEMLDPPSEIIACGFSPKYRDLICALAPFKNHLNLMFAIGTELSDPTGLLTGTGRRARHVRIERIEDIQRPELRDLVLSILRAA